MKKTTGHPLNVLYQWLLGSALDAAATGSIEKDNRPPNSDKEDVVLNLINLTFDQIQLAATNVNLYVPDIPIRQNGATTYVANHARMDELELLAISVLDDFASQTHTFSVSGGSRIDEPETHSHYVNLRVDFQFFP